MTAIRRLSRPLLLAAAIGSIWLAWALANEANLGRLINWATSVAGPPPDNIRKMAGGGRYRGQKYRERVAACVGAGAAAISAAPGLW